MCADYLMMLGCSFGNFHCNCIHSSHIAWSPSICWILLKSWLSIVLLMSASAASYTVTLLNSFVLLGLKKLFRTLMMCLLHRLLEVTGVQLSSSSGLCCWHRCHLLSPNHPLILLNLIPRRFQTSHFLDLERDLKNSRCCFLWVPYVGSSGKESVFFLRSLRHVFPAFSSWQGAKFHDLLQRSVIVTSVVTHGINGIFHYDGTAAL